MHLSVDGQDCLWSQSGGQRLGPMIPRPQLGHPRKERSHVDLTPVLLLPSVTPSSDGASCVAVKRKVFTYDRSFSQGVSAVDESPELRFSALGSALGSSAATGDEISAGEISNMENATKKV